MVVLVLKTIQSRLASVPQLQEPQAVVVLLVLLLHSRVASVPQQRLN
jgi:hypothetical protein